MPFIFSFDPFPNSLMDSGNNFMDRIITISGPTNNCSRAEEKISEKMRQCFEQDVGSFQVSLINFYTPHFLSCKYRFF